MIYHVIFKLKKKNLIDWCLALTLRLTQKHLQIKKKIKRLLEKANSLSLYFEKKSIETWKW